MRGRSEKIHQKFAMSKEMLDRLEAEKQRLLLEKLEEKERRIHNRKESLKRRRDNKVAYKERQIQRTREKAFEQERESCAMASEALESKMRAVEQKKRELKEKQDRKHNAFRYRQMQARLKSAGLINDGGRMIYDKTEDKMLQEMNGDKKPKEFKLWLHLFNEETREKKRREMARMKVVHNSIF